MLVMSAPVITVPVTVVPSSVSVWPLSTVTPPFFKLAPLIALELVTSIVPLSVIVPPVTVLLFSVSSLPLSTIR